MKNTNLKINEELGEQKTMFKKYMIALKWLFKNPKSLWAYSRYRKRRRRSFITELALLKSSKEILSRRSGENNIGTVKKYCRVPFERIAIRPDGEVINCCSTWLSKPIGNIFLENDFDKIWNSEAAQMIRSTMIHGTYDFCSREYCSPLLKGTYKPVEKKAGGDGAGLQEKHKTVLSYGPRIMALSYDPTCNLQCKSCRDHAVTLKPGRIEKILKFQEKLLQSPFFKDIRELILSGSGDPFASKILLSLLKNINEKGFPHLRITLMTNGVLLTPGNWEKLANVHYAINIIKISIDAAARETYEKLRGRADFDILMDNLKFISGLKRQKDIKLHTVFVMQKENYREMPMFIELAKKYNFDYVHFCKVNNLGTYTKEEFRQVAVHRKDHPEHKDFLEILKNPALRDPIVGGDICVWCE